MHFQPVRARRAAPFFSRLVPLRWAGYATDAGSYTMSQSLSAHERTRILQRYRQYLNERKQVTFALTSAVGCGCVMWLLTTKKTVRGQVSEEVAGMAVEILAAEPLQQRVMSVANSLMIKRLSDPATVAAASSMAVRVLDQQPTEDATRGVLFNMLSDGRAEDQVTELFVRVGGKAGTKDAVVTVFRNAFADEDATKIGAEYLRRVVTSPPVVGTCGGTASEQFQLVLNAKGTRQHTHELVASVLETESVQRHAADFVWSSLIGAERSNRKTSQSQRLQGAQSEQAIESAGSKQLMVHGLPAAATAELTHTTSAAEGLDNDSNGCTSAKADHGAACNVAVAAASTRRSRLAVRLDEAEHLLAILLAARIDETDASTRRSRLAVRLDETEHLLATLLAARIDETETSTRRSRLAVRLDEAERLLATLLAARIDEAERVLASRSAIAPKRDATTGNDLTTGATPATVAASRRGSWGSAQLEF